MENNKWISSVSMNSIRVDAAAAKLQNDTLLVTGGTDSLADLSSADMLTQERWETKIPSLPVIISDHCMVTVNSTTVMVVGGWQNEQLSNQTFYFTFGEQRWTQGLELKHKRRLHSCGRIRRDKDSQEMSIIVAGGYNESYMSSVEILNERSNEWHTGPELPFSILYSQMVEDPNGGVVLIGGSPSSIDALETLHQLPHVGKDAVWAKMEQKLKTGRRRHTAVLVPDNIVECSQIQKNNISGERYFLI